MELLYRSQLKSKESRGHNQTVSDSAVAGLRTIDNLQTVGLIAAAMVPFAHLNHEVVKKLTAAVGFTRLQPIWLHCGVAVFFVASGFMMALITRYSFDKPGEARCFFRSLQIGLGVLAVMTLALLAMV